MRILVVTQYFWPENFRINDLVSEWIDRGHEVTILTGLPNYPDGAIFSAYVSAPADFMSHEGARIVRIPMLPRGRGGLRLILNYLTYALSASVIGSYRLRNDSFDIIFTCQLSPVTVGIPAVILRSIKRIPHVLWVLDLWPESLRAVGAVNSGLVLGMVRGVVGQIYARCDLILGQSKSFLPSIAGNSPRQKLIRYFPSWSEDLFSQLPEDPAPEIKLERHRFNILFAGNIGEAQDFPAVINAARILVGKLDIRWIVVGDGRKFDWLRAEIASLGMTAQFVLTGRYALERMPSFYAHADALLVSLRDDPTFAMTIPGKVQSYMSAGLPLLGMLNGEGARAIDESGAGLTAPAGDSGKLASQIMVLAEKSRDERMTMGRRGQQYAQAMFDRTVLMNRLEKWMLDLVAENVGPMARGMSREDA